MAHSTTPRFRSQFFRFQRRAVDAPELGLDEIHPDATVRRILKEEGASWKEILYTPLLTFWAFFWQALSPDHSRRSVVKRVVAWMGRRGQKIDDETQARIVGPARGYPNRPSVVWRAGWATTLTGSQPRSRSGAVARSRWSTARS
jgi:hypothetical protein